jgi:uncharacterized membrane protein
MKSKLTWLEAALLLAPFIVLALVWDKLPPRIPIHWDLHGEINGWASKSFGTLLLPLMSVGIVVLFRILPGLDPRLRRILGEHERMRAVLQTLCVAIAAFLDLIFCIIVAVAMGYAIPVTRIGLGATLLLLATLGNYLGTLRPNYFIGIRTPWTLENAQTWRATHRVGGRLMFFGSLFLLLIQFFLSQSAFATLFLGAIVALVIWAFVYSWHHFRTHAAAR